MKLAKDARQPGPRCSKVGRPRLELRLRGTSRWYRAGSIDSTKGARVARHFLITGGAGFIGSHLTDSLLRSGERVTVLDNLSTGSLRNLDHAGHSETFRFVQGSILDEVLVDELVHSCDLVIHLAAAVGVRLIVDEPLRSFQTNVRGSEIILDSAHRYRTKVFVASTSEIYGKNGAEALSETSDRVLGPPSILRWSYSTSKAVDEILAFLYHQERGLPMVIGRFFNTVGPRQSAAYGMVIPRLVRQALSGEDITVYGDGTQTRCFCHVSDVVDAVRRLVDESALEGQAFNIGGEEEISMLELAERIIHRTNSKSSVRLVSYEEAFRGRSFEDMQRRVPDTTKLRSATGWAPTRGLDTILDEVIAEARIEALGLPAPSSVNPS